MRLILKERRDKGRLKRDRHRVVVPNAAGVIAAYVAALRKANANRPDGRAPFSIPDDGEQAAMKRDLVALVGHLRSEGLEADSAPSTWDIHNVDFRAQRRRGGKGGKTRWSAKLGGRGNAVVRIAGTPTTIRIVDIVPHDVYAPRGRRRPSVLESRLRESRRWDPRSPWRY